MSATAMRFYKISFEVEHEGKHEKMSLNQLVYERLLDCECQ